jgi:hypothetical protein
MEKLALYDDVITNALVDKVGDHTRPIATESLNSRADWYTF